MQEHVMELFSQNPIVVGFFGFWTLLSLLIIGVGVYSVIKEWLTPAPAQPRTRRRRRIG